MCIRDRPLFFLDYIACGKNYPEKIAPIVSGVAEGCKQSGCALVGGAVSYTHLGAFDDLAIDIEKAIDYCIDTVSYTHLDVYKRQVFIAVCIGNTAFGRAEGCSGL